MNRRKFIGSSVALGALGLGTGALWFAQLEHPQDLSIARLRDTLQNLVRQDTVFSGTWNAFQTFSHLAQSVEFSMSAYPQHNSDLFKKLIGKNAFRVFSKQGKMSHALDEPIPGAPAISRTGAENQALARLIKALDTFESYSDELMPHFAYGQLSHAEYSLAHVMHVYNHFEELALKPV